jgi:hypothetical protein
VKIATFTKVKTIAFSTVQPTTFSMDGFTAVSMVRIYGVDMRMEVGK